MNGGAGVFFAGLVSKEAILKLAPKFFSKNFLASSFVSNAFEWFALNVFPSEFANSAVILYDDCVLNS